MLALADARVLPAMLEVSLWDLFGSIRSMKAQRDTFVRDLSGIARAHPTTGETDGDWQIFQTVLTQTRDHMKEVKDVTRARAKHTSTTIGWTSKNLPTLVHGYIRAWKSNLVSYMELGWHVNPIQGITEMAEHSFAVSQEAEPTLEQIQTGIKGGHVLEKQFESYAVYVKTLLGRYYFELKGYYDRTYQRGGGRGHAGQQAEVTWEVFVVTHGATSYRTAARYKRLYLFMAEFPGMLLCGENFTQLMAWITPIRAYFAKNEVEASFFNLSVPEGLEIPPPRQSWTLPDFKQMKMRFSSALGRYREAHEAANRLQAQAEQLNQQREILASQAHPADPVAGQMDALMADRIATVLDGASEAQDAAAVEMGNVQDAQEEMQDAQEEMQLVGDSPVTYPQGYVQVDPSAYTFGDADAMDAGADAGAAGASYLKGGPDPHPLQPEIGAYPAAIAFARQMGIDLSQGQVTGTGHNGQIKVSDIKRFMQFGE